MVIRSSAVATGEDENGALPATSLVNAVDDSFFDEVSWAFHGHTIVRWAPTTAENRYVLETIVERSRFINVRYGTRQYANTSDLGFVGETKTTYGVLDCGYLTCASCAVVVIGIFWGWKCLMVIKVMRIIGILDGG